MKPYAAKGRTPKKAATKKAKAVAGSVKKSVVKAKTNVVKAGRKKLNKAAKDEVDDLLEQTATNGSAAEGQNVTVTPSASQKAVAKTQVKKLKSMVSLKSYAKMEEEAPTPTRKSQRLSQRGGAAAAAAAAPEVGENGHSEEADAPKPPVMMDISTAEEAVETNGTSSAPSGPGFFKKTMSRIWKLPADAAAGVAYQDINGADAQTNGGGPEEATAGKATNKRDSCLIS